MRVINITDGAHHVIECLRAKRYVCEGHGALKAAALHGHKIRRYEEKILQLTLKNEAKAPLFTRDFWNLENT